MWIKINDFATFEKKIVDYDLEKKELTIGSETYHVQILGFDHDDLSNGTGKAGITVYLKEVMTTDHVMNSFCKNIGGWRDSKMRTYLQNDILSSLPNNLQSVILSFFSIASINSGIAKKCPLW